MNRVGMVVDMSHSAERSTLEAIELSSRPIAITHANPLFFRDALRNKSDAVLRALGESGGMLGFSVYPFHLKDGPDCKLVEFCEMIARTSDLMGVLNVGLGTVEKGAAFSLSGLMSGAEERSDKGGEFLICYDGSREAAKSVVIDAEGWVNVVPGGTASCGMFTG